CRGSIVMNGSSNGHGNHNGNHNGNGSHRWWQIWKWGRTSDLSAYRRLALQLHFDSPRSDSLCRSVLIVTPNESRLCARDSLTLASCMAEELNRPVLLVDATPDSEVSDLLNNPASPGVTDFLADPMRPLPELVHPTSKNNVWFLSHGTIQGIFPASPEN